MCDSALLLAGVGELKWMCVWIKANKRDLCTTFVLKTGAKRPTQKTSIHNRMYAKTSALFGFDGFYVQKGRERVQQQRFQAKFLSNCHHRPIIACQGCICDRPSAPNQLFLFQPSKKWSTAIFDKCVCVYFSMYRGESRLGHGFLPRFGLSLFYQKLQ